MGTDAIGYVLYTADGRFSITISCRGRARFAAGDLLSGTTEEKAQAMSAGPLLLAGKQQVPRLVWERVDPPSGAD